MKIIKSRFPLNVLLSYSLLSICLDIFRSAFVCCMFTDSKYKCFLHTILSHNELAKYPNEQ